MTVPRFNVRRVLRFAAALGLAVAGLSGLQAAEPAEREFNGWPFVVQQKDPAGRITAWTGAGPFLFRTPNADYDGNTAHGFRPFWVQFDKPSGEFRSGHFLYPLFSYSVDEETYHWSVFELIRQWGRRSNAGPTKSVFDEREQFEVFPFWFSRQGHDPADNYRALFPIYGTVKHKYGFERLSWTLFPLYVQNEKHGAVTTSTPWPIIRVTRGAAHGWGIWPLFNYVDRPGVSRYETYLWPFGFNSIRYPSPDDPPGTPPRRDVGALPFYTKSTGPGYINEDYLWPFFGYTDYTKAKSGNDFFSFMKKAPDTPAKRVHYHETRYFWPLFVQGRGDEKFINRWAPFYTHSVVKGYDKEWYGWPLVRHAQWTDEGIDRTRTQFLYFLYWNEQQQAAGRTNSPTAQLTHVWPFFSRWDNGAGRRQWQFLSPFEVFFPQNDKTRQAWSPFFAIARHERRAPGDARTSLLWNLVTWERHETEQRSEFHLGPLVGVTRAAEEKRVAIGNGLLGFRRSAAGGWRMFWLDFPSKTASAKAPPSNQAETSRDDQPVSASR